ncbi:hypothetical protein R6Q59_006273 [Mikania micrantha]
MAKFSPVMMFAGAGVVLLLAMAAVADASTRTIFTTTTFEENPSGRRGTGSDCYKQIMDQQMLSHCGMYLMKLKGERSQGPRIENPEEDHKQLCCMQLKNLDQECMCPGIKMMMNQPMWRMMGQMMSVAQNLPTECNLMSQPCQMQAVWF